MSLAKNNFISLRLLAWAAAIFAFLLYANTIGNDYAVDDTALITLNPAVQKGFSGVGEILTSDTWQATGAELGYYRPLSLITFAAEHQLFGTNPHISHLINALLYGVTIYLLVLLLAELLSNTWLAFLAVLLFAAHPVHTEVVANIKGRDEILAVLNLVACLWLLVKALTPAKTERLKFTCACICFMLALLSKETAYLGILFIASLLLCRLKISPLRAGILAMPFIMLAALFVFIKSQYFTGSGAVNDIVSFPYADSGVRLSAALQHFAMYTKLVVVPYPLSYNYAYNQVPGINGLNVAGMAGLFLLIALTALFFGGWKKYPVISASIFIFLAGLAPAAGFVLLRGGVFAERFLFLPSLGYCLAVAWLFFKAFKIQEGSFTQHRLKLLLPAALLLGFTGLTLARNNDWKNDYTLSGHDVNVTPDSCQVHLHYGKTLVDMGVAETDPAKKMQYFNLGASQLRQSLNINPHYSRALFKLGYAYQALQPNNDSAVYYYRQAITEAPDYVAAYNNLATLYAGMGRLPVAEQYFRQALRINPNQPGITLRLQQIQQQLKSGNQPRQTQATDSFSIYLQNGMQAAYAKNFQVAASYISKAVEINPSSVEALVDLGTCYGRLQQFDKSETALTRAYALQPQNPNVIRNLYILYRLTGNKSKEQEFKLKLDALGR